MHESRLEYEYKQDKKREQVWTRHAQILRENEEEASN